MTNADKFEEVFGFEPKIADCVAVDCLQCPIADWKRLDFCEGCGKNVKKWWYHTEYKEPEK